MLTLKAWHCKNCMHWSVQPDFVLGLGGLLGVFSSELCVFIRAFAYWATICRHQCHCVFARSLGQLLFQKLLTSLGKFCRGGQASTSARQTAAGMPGRCRAGICGLAIESGHAGDEVHFVPCCGWLVL